MSSLLRETLICAKCRIPVEKVSFENDHILLRKRIVAECHGAVDTFSEQDERFWLLRESGNQRPKVYVFQRDATPATVHSIATKNHGSG